jgi:hypothetical protein
MQAFVESSAYNWIHPTLWEAVFPAAAAAAKAAAAMRPAAAS